MTFVSPPNPATGKKEYKTKNLTIPFRELEAQGWTPPQGDSAEDDEEAFSEPSDGVQAYAERQIAKAKANLERQTIAQKGLTAFFGPEVTPTPIDEDPPLPGSFLPPELAETVFSEAGL